MSLFVLSCKDGWVSIMYDGLDAVGVDQQVRKHGEKKTRQKENGENVFFEGVLCQCQACLMWFA